LVVFETVVESLRRIFRQEEEEEMEYCREEGTGGGGNTSVLITFERWVGEASRAYR
jgi:hypothetical protein